MLLHRFAVATAAATYLLILVGGLVHGTGSSLACPDWPLCYGSLMPEMKGGVAVEHSHRLAASVVAMMTVVVAVLATRARRRQPHLVTPAWIAVVLVLVQALLGGITVLAKLPAPVSTLHTAVSLLFLMAVLYVAVMSRPGSAAPSRAAVSPPLPERATRLVLVALVATYAQMVLGGLVRHSGAALACTDIPLCRGALWPEGPPPVIIHALHRLGGVLVAGLVIASSVVTVQSGLSRAWLARLAMGGPLLVLAQVALGVSAVTSMLSLPVVEAHLGVATALLCTQLLIFLLGRSPAAELAPGLSLLTRIRDVIALTKPRITGLVMATFAGGMWLAPGELPRWRVIATVLGTALVVAAANALNMYLERDADGLMERTRHRPLPDRRLSPDVALALGTGMVCAALPLLLLAGNATTGLLAGTAFVAYVGIYTPLKRRSPAALFVGAIPGAMPPLMGWTAVTGRMDAPGLVLFAILFLWQVPHFLAIALYRAEDYDRAGFRVLPATQSAMATRIHIVVFSVVLVLTTTLLAPLQVAGPSYVVAALALGMAFIGWSAAGLRRVAARAWARSLFLVSIVYLTLLFAALIIDRTIA